MKTSELLRKAKTQLWDGVNVYARYDEDQHRYICAAVDSVGRPSLRKEKLLSEISDRLWPAPAMGLWLVNQGVPEQQLTSERIQAHRHVWVDMLIKEYEAKGD